LVIKPTNYAQKLSPQIKFPSQRFWWMFVTRNLVDHIFPFFLLVILNFHIIRALRRERLRATHQHLADMLCSSAAPPLVTAAPSKSNSERSRRGSVRSLRESLKNKVRLRNRLQKVVSPNSNLALICWDLDWRRTSEIAKIKGVKLGTILRLPNLPNFVHSFLRFNFIRVHPFFKQLWIKFFQC
jgi:hypothetical protein